MAHTIVIFGASGDLTRRKLIPALYELHRKKRLPPETTIVGMSRTQYSHDQWREVLREATAAQVGPKLLPDLWDEFARRIYYYPGDVSRAEDFPGLNAFISSLEAEKNTTRVYYLSLAPEFYECTVEHLGQAGMADETHAPRRIVVEKPFGRDLQSARVLNAKIHEVFAEHQIYRIDHYLGKETVANVLVLRFANTIFEPIWNRRYVDHVQITAAENLPVGRRAAFYESAGILRDMFQNHLLQLLTLTAMEPPSRVNADDIRDEKVKVLRAVRPFTRADVAANTVRGQYRKYRDEPGVPPNSQTATFGVVKLSVDNWRWQGVPFYLRSGKAMSCRTTQIVIQFREPPHMMFEGGPRRIHEANRLVLQIQPAEGIQIHFQTKVPDAGMKMRLTDLDFNFREKFAGEMPEAYERLLLDVMMGDPSLFARADEVELAWNIVDPIQEAWDEGGPPQLELYEAGGWGPPYSEEWMQRQGREWFNVCPVIANHDESED